MKQSCDAAVEFNKYYIILQHRTCTAVKNFSSLLGIQYTLLTVILADVMPVISPVVFIDSNTVVVYTDSRAPVVVIVVRPKEV